MAKRESVQKENVVYVPRPIIHLAKNSKMPCRSLDFQAGVTCKGSVNSDGSVANACMGCYAKGGFFRMPSVIKARADNKLACEQDDFVQKMIKELDLDRYFRVCASGDLYSIKLWEKIYEIAVGSPHCKIWIPTRMYKLKEFREIIDKVASLPNVRVRFSSDSITGGYIEGLHGSTIIRTIDDKTSGMFVCPAPEQGGKCDTCRACWSKDIPVIAYIAHGQAIKRVYKYL